METICQACGYQRKPTDQAPDWECPKCGKAYAKTSHDSPGSLSGNAVSIKPSTKERPHKDAAYQNKTKGFKVVTYLLISIFAFALAFLAEMLIIPRYVPTPTLKDFNHPYEVTGRFRYYRASRDGSSTWVNDTELLCVASATDFHSCIGHMKNLADGTPITAELVKLKMRGDRPITMSIKSAGTDVFSQTPMEFIESWQSLNYYWFSCGALIFAIMVVSLTHITKTTNWSAMWTELTE